MNSRDVYHIHSQCFVTSGIPNQSSLHSQKLDQAKQEKGSTKQHNWIKPDGNFTLWRSAVSPSGQRKRRRRLYPVSCWLLILTIYVRHLSSKLFCLYLSLH